LENENITSEEGKTRKSKPSFLMTLIIVIVVALIISGITSFFIVRILTSNVSSSSNQSSQVSATTPARVILITEGSRYTMMLKGGYDIAVIDSLQLDVGSNQARDLIHSNRIEVLEAIRMIFMNKTRGELSTPQGIELTKKQIKDSINEMMGFTGERESLGVIKVTMIIMTITTSQ
jgi:flagellar FliL protein